MIEDALHRRTVAGTVLGEEVSQWVAGADAAAGEAASDEIADDSVPSSSRTTKEPGVWPPTGTISAPTP